MITTVILQTYEPYEIGAWPGEMEVEIVCKQWNDLFAIECGDVILSFFTLRIGEFL